MDLKLASPVTTQRPNFILGEQKKLQEAKSDKCCGMGGWDEVTNVANVTCDLLTEILTDSDTVLLLLRSQEIARTSGPKNMCNSGADGDQAM